LVHFLPVYTPIDIHEGRPLCGHVVSRLHPIHYYSLTAFSLQVIFIIGSSFQCFAQQLIHIFIGRAVGGVGVGALRYVHRPFLISPSSVDPLKYSMLSPIYMAEISPPEVRGSLMALEQFSIVLGVVFGFWTGFATRECERSPCIFNPNYTP